MLLVLNLSTKLGEEGQAAAMVLTGSETGSGPESELNPEQLLSLLPVSAPLLPYCQAWL